MFTLKQFTGVALTLAASISLQAVVIFQEDFNGTPGANLNGTTPTITTGGATWNANPVFDADGSVADTADGGAWLAFVPQAGEIYQLTASFDVTSGGTNWLSLGFADSTADQRAVITGYTSYLQRNNADVVTFTGLGVSAGRIDYDGVLSNANVTVTMVLDATDASSSNWTVSIFAEDSLGNTVSRPASLVGSGNYDDISAVGFSVNEGASAQISSFELSTIPEPQTTALMVGALAMGVMLVMRRRQSGR